MTTLMDGGMNGNGHESWLRGLELYQYDFTKELSRMGIKINERMPRHGIALRDMKYEWRNNQLRDPTLLHAF